MILSPSLPTLARFRMSDYPFPVVLVDRCDRETNADAVVLDNVDSAYRLTTHLIEQGYQRIAFIYGTTSATGRQRHEGYVTAMATMGWKPDPGRAGDGGGCPRGGGRVDARAAIARGAGEATA